jgi:hypothetical protein
VPWRVETRSRRACASGPRLGNWWALTAALASSLFQLLYCSRPHSRFPLFPSRLTVCETDKSQSSIPLEKYSTKSRNERNVKLWIETGVVKNYKYGNNAITHEKLYTTQHKNSLLHKFGHHQHLSVNWTMILAIILKPASVVLECCQ